VASAATASAGTLRRARACYHAARSQKRGAGAGRRPPKAQAPIIAQARFPEPEHCNDIADLERGRIDGPPKGQAAADARVRAAQTLR